MTRRRTFGLLAGMYTSQYLGVGFLYISRWPPTWYSWWPTGRGATAGAASGSSLRATGDSAGAAPNASSTSSAVGARLA